MPRATHPIPNPASRRICLREFHFHFVARQQPHKVPFRHPHGMRQNLMALAEVNPKYQLR